MVADNAVFMRRMLKVNWINGGHEVLREVANGTEAAEKHKAYRLDELIAFSKHATEYGTARSRE